MPYTYEDISLEELGNMKFISPGAIYACKKNNLTGLKDIIIFYRKFGTFILLENCSKNIKKELFDLCKKYGGYSLIELVNEIKEVNKVNKLLEYLSVEQIDSANRHLEYLVIKLSVRARNGLHSLFNGTPTIIELIDTVNSPNFTFTSRRNIGVKTVTELDNLVSEVLKYIKGFDINENTKNNTNDIIQPTRVTDYDEYIIKLYSEFNPFKKAALNQHIEYLIANLKIRARNGLISLFGKEIAAKELIETIFSITFDFQSIKNIGVVSVSELNEFKSNIFSFIKKLNNIEDDNLSKEYAKLTLKTTFSNLQLNFDEQFETVLDDNGKIELFKLINILIESHHLLKNKERKIFDFLFTNSNRKTLDQIANELNLSKERLRQLRILFENDAKNYFRFILSFNVQDLSDYGITKDDFFKVIDINFVQSISSKEGVDFNILFYSLIFGLIFENSHSVLGDNERISGKGNYTNTIRFKNCYLIENDIFNSFSFELFTNDVYINLSSRIIETYSLHFEGYLAQYLKNAEKYNLVRIKEICEGILLNEFELVINGEGYIQFERNVRKTLPHYTYEVLKEIGKMTKIEDIVKAINHKYPGLNITEQSVRATLRKEKDLYIYIGRTSTYGLKMWEIENDAIKGGTIRDIAEEYLENFNSPQHIYDIVNYVKKYRKSKGVSIFRNLQAEEKSRFVFFTGGYIGLKTKSYDPADIQFKRVVGTNFRSDILKNFNGWDYQKLIDYYVETYKYTASQVISLFETKIQNGELIVNEDNTISI